MSSTGDAASGSSSSPLHSAQARDEANESGGQTLPSDDDLIEDPFDEDTSESASDLGPRSPSSGQVSTEHNQPSSEEEAAPPLVRKAHTLRQNKYLGSHATWRDRTASERQIATSLDQLRAQDLSVHLYNFYSLKRRVIEPGPRQDEKRENENDFLGTGKKWVSSQTWTAWPMPPHLVPRESDANPWDPNAGQDVFVRKDERISSHKLLQEILAALACKKAKERFYEREWEDSGAESPPTPTDPWLERQSQRQSMLNGLSRSDEDEPVVMVDDERAKRILRPSLNHILAKLDALLAGLHHARSSYATSTKKSKRPRAATEDESSTDNDPKGKRSHTRARKERSRRQKASPDPTEGSSAASSQPEISRGRRSGLGRRSAEPFQRGRSRIKQLGLRDWSDVLGVASICGWDAGVVHRAATRCAAMFEEGLVLRTLHEGQSGYHDTRYLPERSTAENLQSLATGPRQVQAHTGNAGVHAISRGPDLSEVNHNGMYGGVHVDGFLQTIPMHKSWSRRRRERRKK
ncbi:MAG: hypothetical protein LQ348_004365 [Seirophora lacunosa]|nr:MAG: hypothetical protein LQ348_004365 [Seirophora lacunosa]